MAEEAKSRRSPLKDSDIARLGWRARRFFLSDGRGLRLAVYPNGKRTWQLRFEARGKQAVLTVGYWPEMKALAARRRARIVRAAIAAGEDPRQSRQMIGSLSVAAFAQRWITEVVAKRRKDPSSVERLWQRDILPAIGAMPIQKVSAADVREIVFRRRDAGREASAMALRDTMHRMFDYARNCGYVVRNPVAEVDRKYVGRLRSRTRALSAAELRLFFEGLKSPRLGAKLAIALELLLLTLARKGELLGARWAHIDLAAGTWEVPAELSKTGVPHVVYLSDRASRLLAMLLPRAQVSGAATWPPIGQEFVFAHQSSCTQPMSANRLNKALLRVKWGMPHFTVHDLRRTGVTMLNEQGYPPDVIEKAANHAVRGGVRGVYNRAQYAAERKKMLAEWAEYLEGLKQ